MATIRKLGVALFGLGRAGNFYLPNLTKNVRVNFLYAVEPLEEKRKEATATYGVECLADGTKVWEDERVEAVIIATPTQTHYELIMQAVKHKKAILAEKPVGFSLKEIDDCYNAANEAKLPFLCAFNRRFDNNYCAAIEAVHAGRCGNLRVIRTTARDYPDPPMDYIAISHGIFHDADSHNVDVIRWASGEEPEEVYSVGHAHDPAYTEYKDFDTVVTVFKFKSGLMATSNVTRYAAYRYDQRVELLGDKGMAQVENVPATSAVIADGNGFNTATCMRSFPERFAQSYDTELDHFLDMVLDGAAPKVVHKDARNAFLICDACSESARIGKPVKINYDQ